MFQKLTPVLYKLQASIGQVCSKAALTWHVDDDNQCLLLYWRVAKETHGEPVLKKIKQDDLRIVTIRIDRNNYVLEFEKMCELTELRIGCGTEYMMDHDLLVAHIVGSYACVLQNPKHLSLAVTRYDDLLMLPDLALQFVLNLKQATGKNLPEGVVLNAHQCARVAEAVGKHNPYSGYEGYKLCVNNSGIVKPLTKLAIKIRTLCLIDVVLFCHNPSTKTIIKIPIRMVGKPENLCFVLAPFLHEWTRATIM